MKTRRIYLIWSTLAAIFTLQSCGLEEPVNNGTLERCMEFVGRPVGFNDVNVLTKSEASEFESTIHNSFLLVYNEESCIYYSGDLGANPQVRVTEKLKGATKACFIANYPIDKVIELSKSGPDALNSEVLELTYALLTGNNPASNIGIPELDLDNDSSTSSVRCIPMFGTCTIDETAGELIQIPIKRLLSKVTLNMSLSVDVDWNIGELWTPTQFKLNSCTIKNLPKKVRLSEPESDSNYDSVWNTEENLTTYNAPIGVNGFSIENENTNTNYTLTFYVPEYYLQPLSSDQYYNNGYPENTYGTQEYKPKMYDADEKYPLYLDIKGLYTPTSGNEVNLEYFVYLGENSTTSFTLKRNKHYTNQLVIKGVRYSSTDEVYIDHRVETDPNLGLSESTGETANCYLICDEGTYYFPAVKGALIGSEITDDDYCDEGDVVVIAKDNSEIQIENCSYNSKDKTIVFDVTKVADGNVVIALKNGDDDIQWSWHLWFNAGFTLFGSELSKFELELSDPLPNGTEFVEMNLGAKSGTITLLNQNDAIGPYYRYGYREPYFKNVLDSDKYDYHGGLEVYSAWSGDSKSKTDPCPPGYRVPAKDAWDEDGWTADKTHNALSGAFLYYDGMLYPYSGYVDEAGTIQSQGFSDRDTTYNYSVDIPANQTNLSSTDLNYTNYYQGPVKFTNVQYSKYDIHNLGVLSAQDEGLSYSFVEKGIDIISCTVQKGTWKVTGTTFFGFPTGYTAQYNTSEILTGEELKSKYETEYNRLISVINGSRGSNSDITADYIIGLFTAPTVTCEFKQMTSNSEGYQIRCVKE